jgi:ankyrin repeat protein
MKSLMFAQMDARQMTISTAHAKTCTWLLETTQYRDWMDTTKKGEHHGFLWLKGNAGTGKSTLMKFAWAKVRSTMDDRVILSYFFNARGEDMEKSTTGTYQSLLLQLLEHLPDLQDVFNSLGIATSNISRSHHWNVESLKSMLQLAIQSLGNSSVVCFIDALDECEVAQIRDMVHFLERTSDLAMAGNVNFQVCFSSRHYPHITMRHGLELVLEREEGHTQDIASYVQTELRIGYSNIAQQIRVELQEKASGIFLWVVIVVSILNKESDRGQVHALQQKLKEIPSDLHELFRDILTRDTLNRDALVLCIQWVLFAKQPLSPEQLHHAILSAVDPQAMVKWAPEQMTETVARLFVLNSSKGLAEITISEKPTVQFIHESVKDFFLKDNGLGEIWDYYGSNFQGRGHNILKHCCLIYIRIAVLSPSKYFKDLQSCLSSREKGTRYQRSAGLDFLVYAVRNVLSHADSAEGGGISQVDFLRSFYLPRWVKLHNLLLEHREHSYRRSVSFLYVLAELGMTNLMAVIGSASRYINMENERYGCPLFATIAAKSKSTLALCIASLETQQVDERPGTAANTHRVQLKDFPFDKFNYSRGKEVMLAVLEFGRDDFLSLMVRTEKFNNDAKDPEGRTVLWRASEKGWERSVRSLLDAGSLMIDSKDKHAISPLCIALENGYTAVAELLIERGANVNAQGGGYGNALQAASAKGNKYIATLLLANGADPNARGGVYGNALQAALVYCSRDIVALLLNEGADVNAQGGSYGNALQAASLDASTDMVTLLLEKGAKVNARGGHYETAIHAALAKGNEDVATLLLANGADPNAQGTFHRNALQAASAYDFRDMVALLLNKGAAVNAQGGYYGNALQVASARGHYGIAALLLDNGAHINARGGHHGNALQAATESGGSKETVALLIDKGADVNAQGGFYGNALQATTASGGPKEIVQLLLDKKANVNAQGGHFGNALQAATAAAAKEIVELLLDHGADVNAQGGMYSNALQAALDLGLHAIAKLLRSRGAIEIPQSSLH